MTEKWPTLSNSPVVVALFQIKFEMGETQLKDFLQYDAQLKRIFLKGAITSKPI